MKCTMSTFDIAVNEILEDAELQVVKLTDKAIDEAANLVKDRLVSATPSGAGHGGHLKDGWKIKKGKHRKVITNSKKVKGKSGNIPLVNILEYSSAHGHPFVENTVNGCMNDVKSIFEKDISLK